MKSRCVNIDPEIMGGEPVFMGTRVPIKTLFEHLESGYTLEEFLDWFPSVTREAAVQVLKDAHELVVGRSN
jgi:uncharacterized protein (DUF433 family)